MALSNSLIKKIVRQALEEDAVSCDITTLDFIDSQTAVEARIVAKENGIVCGVALACEVFRSFDKSLRLKVRRRDGNMVRRDGVVLSIKGRARSVLSCERVALNFLSYLSGIATRTRGAVAQASRRGIKILDTRKTTPTLRLLEKYAVKTGGGENHRMDLSGRYLVKDNHVFILEKTRDMERLAGRRRKVPFEIEVQNLKELKRSLFFSPDILLLDNLSPSSVRKVAAFLKKMFPHKKFRPLVELSGGIHTGNVSRYCISGVDFISLGALTHSAPALDMSLEIVKVYSR